MSILEGRNLIDGIFDFGLTVGVPFTPYDGVLSTSFAFGVPMNNFIRKIFRFGISVRPWRNQHGFGLNTSISFLLLDLDVNLTFDNQGV